MANTKSLKNLTQFYSFNLYEFAKDKDFYITEDPQIECGWDEKNKKSDGKVKDIKVFAEVEHDNTQYVDTKGVPVDVHNRRYPVVFKFKLPENLVGQPKDSVDVQKYLGAFSLAESDIIKITNYENVSCFYKQSYGLYITVSGPQDIEIVSQD